MVMTGFLEEKPKREIQLFHEEIQQDCVYVQHFPGASAGDKASLAPSQEGVSYVGYGRYISDTSPCGPCWEI